MSEFQKTPEATTLVEQRVAALEQVFIRRNLIPTGFVAEFTRTAEEGKREVIVGESPPFPFPDAAAHNLQAQDEPTYDVRFSTEDLWPQSADEACVHVSVFHSCLETAA
jgi:Nitrile hydratase beta subunit